MIHQAGSTRIDAKLDSDGPRSSTISAVCSGTCA